MIGDEIDPQTAKLAAKTLEFLEAKTGGELRDFALDVLSVMTATLILTQESPIALAQSVADRIQRIVTAVAVE